MGRKLITTVQIGSEVYAAGTDEHDIQPALREQIVADVWGDGAPGSGGDHAGDLDVAELENQFAQRLSEKDVKIAELVAEIEGLKDDQSGRSSEPAESPKSVDYSAFDIDALKAEIDKRNEGRDSDTKLSKRGSVETLAEALVADDKQA